MTLSVFVIKHPKIRAQAVFILAEDSPNFGKLAFIAIRQKISAKIVIYSSTKQRIKTEKMPIIKAAF